MENSWNDAPLLADVKIENERKKKRKREREKRERKQFEPMRNGIILTGRGTIFVEKEGGKYKV